MDATMTGDLVPLDRLQAAAGWRYDDRVLDLKLGRSLETYGQLRPLLVRQLPGGLLAVVEGRRLLSALRALGRDRAWVLEVPAASDDVALGLALELRYETDYAALAAAIAGLLDRGYPVDRLAACSPFTTERLGHFRTLAAFDWSQFSEGSELQVAIDWDLPPGADPADVEPTVVLAEEHVTAAELRDEAAAAPPETPAVEVVESAVRHARQRRTRAAGPLLFGLD